MKYISSVKIFTNENLFNTIKEEEICLPLIKIHPKTIWVTIWRINYSVLIRFSISTLSNFYISIVRIKIFDFQLSILVKNDRRLEDYPKMPNNREFR